MVLENAPRTDTGTVTGSQAPRASMLLTNTPRKDTSTGTESKYGSGKDTTYDGNMKSNTTANLFGKKRIEEKVFERNWLKDYL